MSRQFDHLGAPYRDQSQYASITTSFVQAALKQGNPVLVAVPGSNVDVIRDALGSDAAEVIFANMADEGRNPGWIIPGVLLSFARLHHGRRISVIGEPTWAGRDVAEYPACVTHEALINLAFADQDAEILCPYDTSALSPEAAADADRTHPVLTDGFTQVANPDYADPADTIARFNLPLAAPGEAETLVIGGLDDLAAARKFVATHGASAGLSETSVAGLVLAVNELVCNTIRHTPSTGQLAVWTTPGVMICQVSDTGDLTDPLAGRVPPAPGSHGGHGLILVNQLVDLVRVHTGSQGTTIRLHQRF